MKWFWLVALCIVAGGCDSSVQQAKRSAQSQEPVDALTKIVRAKEVGADKEEALQGMLEDLVEAEKSLPKPVTDIEFPVVDDWAKSEPRPLPDDGFSIAYSHEKGMTVTLYQYTRGLRSIPDDVEDDIVVSEFSNSQSGLTQAVELGIYDALELKDQEIIKLGDSNTDVQWANYIVERGGVRTRTEVFVWAYKNRFFKIRLSSSPRRAKSKKAALKDLLTEIGKTLDPNLP